MRVIVRRLLLGVPLLFIVSALNFLLLALIPGDPVKSMLGDSAAIPTMYNAARHQLGLDKPLYARYWIWVSHAVRGDFGTSIFTGTPVRQLLDRSVPVTLSLIFLSLLLIGVVGIGLGILSAVRGGAVARFVDAFSLTGFALPSFWLAAVLVSFFAVKTHWFPVVGYVTLGHSFTGWLRALALPVITLSVHSIAVLAKQTREAMLDALGSEYVRTARANGIRTMSILFQHALKNASIRVVTIFGLLTVGLLSGTVIVESVFSLPGMGGFAIAAVTSHDFPEVEAVVVYYTAIVIVVNLIVDVAYTFLNPRVRV